MIIYFNDFIINFTFTNNLLNYYFCLYFIDGDLLLKKENSGKIKKIKANVIHFDQNLDDIQTAEEVKSDEDVLLACGNESATISINSYDKIVRFKLHAFKIYINLLYGLIFRQVILLENLMICQQLKTS